MIFALFHLPRFYNPDAAILGMSALPLPSGWFLVQFIAILSSKKLYTLRTQYNLTLESKNRIYPGCFECYLTNYQIDQLLKHEKSTLSLTPMSHLPKSRSLKNKFKSPRCMIRATPNWSPVIYTSYQKMSTDLYVVNQSCNLLKSAHDSRIKSFSDFFSKKQLNRYVTGFIQSGSQDGHFENRSFVSQHPFYDLGIRGEGQIIAISDSGVDLNHNFFYDPNHGEVVINKTLTDHRKMHAYYSVADATDNLEGHGSHCSGIALGEAYDSDSGLSLYNGAAPKAKLFFLDLGYEADVDGQLGGIFNGEEMYTLMYKEGVRVSSNSWGYDSFSSEVQVEYDTYAYNFPELLFVFAAGNEGSEKVGVGPNEYFTINSPGSSKNCLSIGSINRPSMAYIELAKRWDLEIFSEGNIKFNSINNVLYESYGVDPFKSTTNNPMTKLGNLTVKSYLSESDISYENSLVVMKNDAEFCQNIVKAAAKGASAVFHPTNSANCTIDRANITIFHYSSVIPEFSDLTSLSGKTVSFFPVPTNPKDIKLSWFSSLGPTKYGVNKPDLVVPGDSTISALSGDPHRKYPLPADITTLMENSGTSMATPALAGLSALARQFFVDGFYPTRQKNPAHKISNVSATLIRAVLINSATPFESTKYGPNIRTGFGVPDLSSALLRQPLRIVANSHIKPYSKHTYPLIVQSNNDSIKVTMAFLDPPLSADSASPHFADLDLRVVSPSGLLYTGNGLDNNQSETSNTIERVFVPRHEVEVGEYFIVVTSTDFDASLAENISYSVVVNGPFDHFDLQTNPINLRLMLDDEKCEVPCLNSGKCVNGRCKCGPDHTGHDCGMVIHEYKMQEKYVFDMKLNELMYFKIPIGFYNSKDKPTIYSNTDLRSLYAIYLSDKPFLSMSEPDVLAIVDQGDYSAHRFPISVTGTDDEIKESVVYFALRIIGPKASTKMSFEFSVKNYPFPSSSQSAITVGTSEIIQDSPHNEENYEDGSMFERNMFMFFTFTSLVLIVLTVGFIIAIVIFKCRQRNTNKNQEIINTNEQL